VNSFFKTFLLLLITIVLMSMSLRDYFHSPPNALLILALFSFCLYLSLETITRIYNLFAVFPPIDIPLHFLSGVGLYFLFFWVGGFFVDKNHLRHWWAFGLTFTFAILLEIGEVVQEMFVYNPPYLQDFFFWDGFFDIFWTLVACALTFLLIEKLKEKTKFLSKEI